MPTSGFEAKALRVNTSLAFAIGLAGVVAALMPFTPALAQGFTPLSTAEGYAVERSQSVENAPRGSVGRKTTDREHRVGNREETDGNETTVVFTFGGFVRKCPTAEGIVEGTFEYSLLYDEINTDDGESQHNHVGRRLVAKLKGHVRPDATLERVELDGEYTSETSGTRFAATKQQRPVRTTFRPGSGGEPDWPAAARAVEMAGDVAIAAVVLWAGEFYKAAEGEWRKSNECVEFSFDPQSETRSLGPNEAAQVRIELRTKEGREIVPWKSDSVGAINGAGTVSPRSLEAEPGAPATVTYTASSQPRRGHGIDLATASRAGIAEAKWLIAESDTYELRFDSTITSRNPDEAVQSIATGTIRLSGSNKISPLYGVERRLFNGRGTLSYTTTALPGRDECSPLISGSGTTELTVADAHIDIATERDLNGTATGGRAEIEMGYGITFAFSGGETMNIPFMREFTCVLLPERATPYPFWMPAYLSSREADGQVNFLNKSGWTYVGQGDVIAKKTLRGDCGGLCDEEVTVFTLKKANPSAASAGGR
jgi:hypothetical protein